MHRKEVVLWNLNKVMEHILIVIQGEINLSNRKRSQKLKKD